MAKARLYYDKILANIESSENELHVRTCTTMIGMFKMRFADDEDQNDIAHFEHNMKEMLDQKAHKLGIINI